QHREHGHERKILSINEWWFAVSSLSTLNMARYTIADATRSACDTIVSVGFAASGPGIVDPSATYSPSCTVCAPVLVSNARPWESTTPSVELPPIGPPPSGCVTTSFRETNGASPSQSGNAWYFPFIAVAIAFRMASAFWNVG